LKPLRRASPFLSSGRSRKIQDTNIKLSTFGK
jgi:hypothetical protein